MKSTFDVDAANDLIEAVIFQIRRDIEANDLDALHELLRSMSPETLATYLP